MTFINQLLTNIHGFYNHVDASALRSGQGMSVASELSRVLQERAILEAQQALHHAALVAEQDRQRDLQAQLLATISSETSSSAPTTEQTLVMLAIAMLILVCLSSIVWQLHKHVVSEWKRMRRRPRLRDVESSESRDD